MTNKSTIWDDTYGCAEKYRSPTALYLLSMLSHTYKILIDCGVGSPVHGKDVVFCYIPENYSKVDILVWNQYFTLNVFYSNGINQWS